jgi:hypothetical protein
MSVLPRRNIFGISLDKIQGMSNDVLLQTNKRLTMNLLIQGAAAHAFLTAHHLVRDELEAIRPGLTKLYDKWVLSAYLNYWIGDLPIIHGRPSRFWRRVRCVGHPFHEHRFLARHGNELSCASKRYVTARGWRKGVIGIPIIHYIQMVVLYIRVYWAERNHEQELVRIAKRATSRIWGIDEGRLVAELTLTSSVAFGNLQSPETFAGQMARVSAIGYGGVERRGGVFRVIAKARNWPLVLHELVKGTAELICLHGLNTLDEKTYELVIREADKIEYENRMLQVGSETWRRLLSALPHDRPLPEMLMHMARLDPEPLEELMLTVIDDSAKARVLLATLGE